MRKRIALLLAVVFVITAVFTSYSIKALNSLLATQNINETAKVEKIEIFHSYVTQQCLSCILVGGYAEAAVNTYFQNEVPNGKLGMFEKWAKIILSAFFLAVGIYYTVMVFLW